PLYPAAVRANGPDSGQWYLRAPQGAVVSSIDIEAAWARTQGSAGVVVAVLDTGVRFDHPDLGRAAQGGRLLPGYDFVSDSDVGNDGNGRDGDPSDPGDWTTAAENSNRNGKFYQCDSGGTGAAVATASSWHGTKTASLVGAATGNGQGMAGAAPGVSVLPLRVLGKCFGNDSDIQAAMLWAAGISVDGVPDNANPAKVINLSLGGSGACTAAYQSVINQVLARGAVVVAAAGNSAGGPVSTPGNCSGVVTVLALRHVGTKVGFSDLGPEITIAAPGGNCVNTSGACLYPILAATNTGAQGPVGSAWSDSFDITVGTSFSSPLVAGVVGLMFSQSPGLTPAQVRTALQFTARPFPTTGADNGADPTAVPQCRAPSSNVEQLQCYCSTAFCGAGMLDAGAAVAAVAATSNVVARITVATATPTAGSPVELTSGTSSSSGRNIVGWNWQLIDGGGIVSAFGSATNAASATLTPNGAGSFSVRLTVTDDAGALASADQAVTVAAAPVVATPNTPSSG
ncbi:MAG: S8 family serine peptidase, partial [Chitinophagaceae bacterium]|nr:S8 family serine peptidase [Rubrivivax sp.]